MSNKEKFKIMSAEELQASIIKARQDAIDIMTDCRQKNYRLDMRMWQNFELEGVKTTAEQIHACGSCACFAGYVAVSRQWRELPGAGMAPNGSPTLIRNEGCRLFGAGAIGAWLGLTAIEAEALTYCDDQHGMKAYGRRYDLVTFTDVLGVLKRVKKTGTVWI